MPSMLQAFPEREAVILHNTLLKIALEGKKNGKDKWKSDYPLAGIGDAK